MLAGRGGAFAILVAAVSVTIRVTTEILFLPVLGLLFALFKVLLTAAAAKIFFPVPILVLVPVLTFLLGL